MTDKETGNKHYADLLVDFEDSALQDHLKDRKTALDKAELEKVKADEAIDSSKTKSGERAIRPHEIYGPDARRNPEADHDRRAQG